MEITSINTLGISHKAREYIIKNYLVFEKNGKLYLCSKKETENNGSSLSPGNDRIYPLKMKNPELIFSKDLVDDMNRNRLRYIPNCKGNNSYECPSEPGYKSGYLRHYKESDGTKDSIPCDDAHEFFNRLVIDYEQERQEQENKAQENKAQENKAQEEKSNNTWYNKLYNKFKK